MIKFGNGEDRDCNPDYAVTAPLSPLPLRSLGGGEMRKTISNAPAPTTPLPIDHAEPEREAKPRLEKLQKATSPAAILTCHRFWRAASDCDQAIKMAYDPKIDSKHWASVREQWRVQQHDAECRVGIVQDRRTA